MIVRRRLALGLAVTLALGSPLAGWVWHASLDPVFEAHATLQVPAPLVDVEAPAASDANSPRCGASSITRRRS